MGEKTYLILALQCFFIKDHQLSNFPLFYFIPDIFSPFNIVSLLKKKIARLSLVETKYLGHSYQKDVT